MDQNRDVETPSKQTSLPPRESRTALDAEVALRRTGQHHYKVRVYDASPHGCRIEFVERPSLKERVWVRFEGLEAIEAQVCWIDGVVAGVEFLKPIHPAVLDRLVGSIR